MSLMPGTGPGPVRRRRPFTCLRCWQGAGRTTSIPWARLGLPGGGTNRRRWGRSSRYRGWAGGHGYSGRGWLWLLVLPLLAAAFVGVWRLWGWLDQRLMDSVVTVAESRAQALATEMVSRSVGAILDRESYGSFVRVVQDRDGQAAYLLVDSLAISRLQLEVALRIQEALRELQGASIRVPAGQMLGIWLWAARGPDVPVKILPVGNVEISFYSEFREAGINQSLHQIGMDATAVIRLVLPRREEPIRWQIRLPLGEAVIVGQVPSVYAAGTSPWLGIQGTLTDSGADRVRAGSASGGAGTRTSTVTGSTSGASDGTGAGAGTGTPDAGLYQRGPVLTLPLETTR